MCLPVRTPILLVLLVTACAPLIAQPRAIAPQNALGATRAGNTVLARFPCPAGYQRPDFPEASFAHFLRGLPLKPEGAPIHLFDGRLKGRQDVHAAVVDLQVGTKDLQQCADAVMRLWAEYLFSVDRVQELSFRFTNGFQAPFARWMKGERIRVQGNDCSWVGGAKAGATHEDLMNYLEKVFMYAGTASLTKELVDRSSSPVLPGDVFIQGGHPGHAVIVVDVATAPNGEQVFLLAQGYMPAQEIHVLKNLREPAISPWFELNHGDVLVTPEWTFRWDQRKRWP